MKVAVIGPGTMGSGIAQAFAQVEGFEVVLVHYARLERSQQGIDGIIKGLQKRVDRGRMEQAEVDAIAARLTPGLYEACADVDLIVESASEVMAVKKETFVKLDAIAKPECLFTTNTSSLSITELGSGLSRPPLVGLHFFNPAPVMKLVEIIPGLNTPEELVAKVTEIAEAIGKTPVLVQEGPGFVVNRILVPMINEAIGILADGLASAEGIDTAMKLGAAHPMGPLELGDLVGLDVCLAIMEVLQAETGDPKYRPPSLVAQDGARW